MNSKTAIISRDSTSEYSIALIVTPTSITAEKIPHSCLFGGTSNIESSLTKNRESVVFMGVIKETPVDIACAWEPISSGTASCTWTSLGLCRLKMKTTRGALQSPEMRTTPGSRLIRPITRKSSTYIRKKAGITVLSILR